MNRQQQYQQSQKTTQQSQIQQSQTEQRQQQTMSRTETRQFTSHQTVQEGNVQMTGHIQQPALQQIPGFGPNAAPPVFEKVFQNARFAQGGNAIFDGRINGKPQPTVVWTRKGAILQDSAKHKISYNEQTGDMRLAIYQIGPGDEGEYTCTARNQYGEAVCSVFIQPEGFPTTVPQGFQKTQTIKSSEHKTTNNTGTTIQRHQESSEYYTNGYLQEFKVDTFEYRLLREVSYRESITRRYSGESDAQISTTVEKSLGPPAPPQISTKPRNSKLLEGSDAVFIAKVTANPRPRLTWFKNGQRVMQSQKYEISYSNNQATLRVKQAQSEDSGHYTLLVENHQGCVVSSAYLAIEPVTTQEGLIYEPNFKATPTDEPSDTAKTIAPNFVRVCGDRDVTEGKMTRFDCRVTGRPYPEVAWYINGQQVTDDHNHKVLVNESGNHALMITTVGRNDSGVITCVARNKSGETSFQCNLNVIEKEQVVAPKFVERFTITNVREGEPVILHARAVGTPTPRITWQKDGVPITPNAELRISSDSGASTLDIARAKASDAAWYQCTAQNIAGSTATRARLFVEIPQGPTSEPWRLHLPRPTKIIEPEPEPGPEVIYLKHVEPAPPHAPRSEEDRIYPPPQFIIPLRDIVQVEGGKIHFEARIEPVGDPTMYVEWFVNGRSLEASSRATSIFRFGFIALDLLSITLRDGGEYVCRVTSSTGVAESRARLSVTTRATIERTSQHPESLQYIEQLEDYSKYQQTDNVEESFSQKPHFIRPLQDQGELQEGRNAHFEAQLTPVSDPTMKVEWYKDGKPITASSRISTIFNFGYVSLNIMHLRSEDAGTYTVRAVNRMGEAISTAILKVHVRSTVTSDLGIPEQQRYIEKVGELEAYHQQQNQKYVQEIPESLYPPEFKTPIKDQQGIREGEFAHFEARLEPTGDPTLHVEWFKDGKPVEASSRITTFFNFGYVALTIKTVTIRDVGNYTCQAYNANGQATTTAQLSVVSKKDIIMDSQHPGGLQKIQHLEDTSRYSRKTDEEVTVLQKPRFLGPLKGTNKIVEGQRAHFEARVEPQNDSTLKMEWYFNGKLIESANRIQTYHDFGYVALDILSVRGEDTGTYTVVARNPLGEAQLTASMVVETRSSIDTRSMHRGAYEKTQRLEKSPFVEPEYHIEELCKSKPIFVVPLSDIEPVGEGRNIHLECRLEPMGDPTMRVEWYCNGKAVTIGSRFRTYNDFGFVALDIIHATALDSGEYTVRATNQLGSAHTSACVRVVDHSGIVTDTQHEQSLEQINMLEDASRHRRQTTEEITIMQAPQFTRPLHNIETVEGTNVHMECRLQPVGDSSMKVAWFVNGFPIKTGHRFRPAYDFDYVALDLLRVYPEDSGVYTCQARNQLGEAVTSCSVKVLAKKDLLLETQHPQGLEKIQLLEDATRYKRTEHVDEVISVKPRFMTKPKNLENMREGQHAHFECKLEPVTDSNLKVEWYKNGRPITIGHRFRPIHDFGYVALDIIDLIAEDTATYTCRAVNLVGVDEVSCMLDCCGSHQILTETQHQQGLEKIHYLEDRSRYHRKEEIDELTTQAPIFTTSLKNIEIKEGQRAHFECRLIPVSDATMKVQWYHNNKPLKSGSRFTETNNFGFVALDILYTYPEDSGIYTCRAKNVVGEAVTSSNCTVHPKKSIYFESVNENALECIHALEDYSKYQRQPTTEEYVSQAPIFTMPIKDLSVAENQAAHFEARLIPVGDSRLKVQWLRNGVPIQASNRLTTMHDFGYVALNMKYVNPEDSGTYTCRAVNDLGEAVTSATLAVHSKAALQLETQHESALQKLRQLEDSTKYQRCEEEEISVTQAPRFTTQLNGPTDLIEGQSSHYECRIEPYPDTTLKVEWLHNGKPLTTGHRFRTAYDFGFASLDILTVYGEDAGEYTCRATNHLGQAQSSIITKVTTKAHIIRDSQHQEALQKIQYLEDDSRYKKGTVEDAVVLEKPQFGKSLKNIENLSEGQTAHLEATLTPVNDPTMKVEWFCNGRPVQTGHRFKTTYDFGFVALDILYAYAEDSGTYMCRARNAVGEAVTTAAVNVLAKSGLHLETLDEQRLKKIRELETYERPQRKEVEEAPQRPIFLTPLTSLENLKEGEHAHLECRIEPINDANLKIEWYVNGVKLKTGHRFRTTHDFGYIALDILYAYPEDSGTYVCKATNLVGEAVNTCSIKVGSRHGILLDTHHPEGLQKIRELEAQGRPARLEIEEPAPTPPHFITELRGTTHVYEGQTAHFEAQIEPIHDSNLRIEFYHNGKPLPSASRFHITFDFGYISLDISHCVPEDAGEYSVKAINNLGECKSSINLEVTRGSNIVMDSQRPEGLEKIRHLEEQVPYKRPEIDEPITKQRPVFTQPLQNIDSIAEAQTAHFECRLIPVGDSTLKVEWFRNEKPLEDSSRITKVHDFGFVSLDINHVREEDEGIYMCRASNPLGEAVTTASMKIKSKASIQLETQHEQSLKRIQQLEQPAVPRQDQPERVFEKPIFTQLLTGPTELWEGQNAHYEARVVPVGDANLRFEWYVNGIELKLGSRFRASHDFGLITLHIMSTVPEDSGVYSCKAINKSGEAVSSISTKVKSRSSIMKDVLQPDAWEKIQLKEAEMNKVPERFIDTAPQQPPVFTTHLQSYDKLVEGQHILLEAQVEPRTDPNLRVEWYKNGISITTGTRLKSTFDFGHVGMSINSLRGDDSAVYTCKATNLLGEATSTCTLKVEDKHWLLGHTLHPGAIPKLEALERPAVDQLERPEPTYETPIFISHLNNVECSEGDNIHFECQVEPSKDPSMKIEWFVNGKPLPSGSRYKSTYDFGFISLDITHTYEEDSGIYTCKATNSKGFASTSGSLRCTGKQNIYLDTQHPQGKAGFEKVQEIEESIADRYHQQPSRPESQYGKPVWTKPLNPEFKLIEGQPLHLEGTVEPKEDSNLKIEWFINGKSLDHGSRFKLAADFGFVTLDLTDIYERDQGIYTCKASNKAGEAFTSTTIYCTSKSNLIERTQHPKGKEGLERIQDLEDSLHRGETPRTELEEGHAPVFTSEFTHLVNLSEGEIAHFEAGLTPIGDQTMVVEWLYNGKPIPASHRLRTVHAFGMVVLEVLGTKIEDTGTFTCRATNKWGKAEQSVSLQCVDKYMGQKPKFTTQLKDILGLKDGQAAHFECTVVPTNDPNLKIEWFHNGEAILQSSRIKTVSDFGFVVMDISYTQNHDSGEYVCKASNKFGEDYTRATFSAYGRGGVFSESLQPDSLAKIRELESLQGQQTQTPMTPVTEPPKFITQIKDVTKLVEGQSAHFEARLTPVTDPNLVVEWYYNGKKLPHGHRYRTFHDFGIVILDILYCYEENSGTYECRAYNKHGEDSTTATMRCVSKTNLILDSQLPRGMEGGLEKIQTLEDSLIKHRDEKITEETGKAPVFTVPLSNIDSLREGESAHFEGRLIPTDDAKLKVEWFWNGRPLRTGSRFRTFCDFGFVILEISPVYPEDSGEYSCRAFNDYGQAVTTATMKVQGKRSIILESQLPKGMEGTIDRIAELEGLNAAPTPLSPEEDAGKPPEFITTPSDLTLNENSLAHFECRLIPINDASMRVEWFHNGKALWSGSRIKTINDFGFVILEIANIYQRDSGLYTCKATNRHGEATVTCQLQVRGRQGIILEPQLPREFRTGTESIQRLEEILHKKDEILAEHETPNPPKFIVEIKDNLDIPEGGPVHFDCRVEPNNDSTMRIDWFHNGRPFATGSRVHQINDFGFIALDIDYVYSRDAGEYICRATNKWGSCTTKAIVTCTTKQNIDTESQLPSGLSAEKLKELEKGTPVAEPHKEDVPMGPPRFVTYIQSVTVDESESVRFECRVEPRDDPKLRIEWYRNGKPLPMGHRYRNVFDMGFVSLDILYVYGEDSGEYVCRAVNDYGEDRTKANISCKQLPNIILQNQVPKGMKKSETLMQMEAAIKKYTSEVHLTEDDLYDADKKQPPRFVTQIQDQTQLVEMQTSKFECQLAPVGDPNMKVEWFLNGKPLPHKNRFTPIYDFGYVAMNFGWVYPEDSGEYVCRATNLYGMDETRAIIKTAGKPGIIYESQLPKGMKSIERIRELEAAWQIVPEEPELENKARTAPIFVSKPESCTVEEGEWARFCCRVTGHPRPRVMWLVNGNTVVSGSRYKLTYDGMYHMDIPKTRQYDTGHVQVIARSSVGEAVAETELTIIPRHDDYRGVLKNAPRPWYDIDSAEYQKIRDDTELEKVFDERNAAFQESGRQHTVHIQPKMYKEPEAEWQHTVKGKKNEEYFNKLQELENEQVTKEVKLRESSRQFAIPGEKVLQGSMTKGMAHKYQENLNATPELMDQAAIPTLPKAEIPHAQQVQLRKTEKGKQIRHTTEVEIDSKKASYPPEPTEYGAHEREIHVTKQKQTQKEQRGDTEITRHVTETETTDVEHKGKAQERIVQGQVLPSQPPVFTKKIQPCRAFENEQARFEVEFDGDPLPTIKWFREDFPIKSSPDLKIYTFSTKSILVIRQVLLEDSAVFSVLAENRGGAAKCSANLVVEERRVQARGGVIPPSFGTTLQSTHANSGQLVRFDARINGTKPIDVYWLKDGRKIAPDIRYKTLEEDGIHTLLIIEVIPEDSGKYECIAINNAGEARCEADCIVQAPTVPSKPTKPTTPGTEKSPTIVEPLKDQTVREGQAVAFTCKISGKPTPQIKWQKGENIIKHSKYFQMVKDIDNYTLKITEAFPEDEGAYKCIATNAAGTITLQANLRVLAPDTQDILPSLTPLKDVIVPEGSPAQFKTIFSGKPKPTIQWLREGFLIPESPDFQMIQDSNNAILLIPNTYEEDSGIFTVRATTLAGQVERSARLTVKKSVESGVAPHFQQSLTPKILEETQSAILECKVFGTPVPQVKWFCNEKEIKHDKNHKTAYLPETGVATLEILEPSPEDEAIFTVQAQNKLGQAQSRTNLIINKPLDISQKLPMHAPRITKPIKAQVVKPDDDIVLDVEFEGSPIPVVTWFKEGKPLTSTEDVHITTMESKTTLHISKKVQKKSGNYEVSATNPKGEAHTTGSVTVTKNKEMLEAVAPFFIEPIKSQAATIGDTLIMEAVVDAKPAASFQWYQGNVPLSSTSEIRITTTENRSILFIKEVSASDAGPITCRAENAIGSVTCTATINVIEKTEWEDITELEYPRFIRPLSPVTAMDGDNVTFICQVIGKPTPQVQWFFNGTPLQEAKDISLYQDTEGVCMLSISEVFPETAGEYTCVAVNRFGEAVCKTSMSVDAYEYIADSEIGLMTGPSESEEDLLDKTLSDIDFQSDSDVECAPKIVRKLPEVVTTKDGDITRLEVKATGKPKPIGKWLKQGEEIIQSTEFTIEDFEDGTSVLTISEVYPDDTGEIVFEAHNPLGVAITTTELNVESIVGTKEYRKPVWVTHMEELQEALQATRSVPTFVLEIKDVRITELDTAIFECMFSGTPTPDIVWYHNNKIIRNTEKIKIRIQNNKTTCTISDVTSENVGVYTCKAVSDAGVAVTKAKLYVQDIPIQKKKELEIKRAQEIQEKVKKEKVIIDKRSTTKKKQVVIVEDTVKPVEVHEMHVIEDTLNIPVEPDKEVTAKPIVAMQQPLATEATATCKKIEEEEPFEILQRHADKRIILQESLSVSDILSEDNLQEIKEQPRITDRATVTEVRLEEVINRVEKILVREELKMAKEVTETLNLIKAKEFGPGQYPLRELAEIGYLIKTGITVHEITVLYNENKFPSLTTPNAQSALVNVVERKGYSALISEVLTEEKTTDEGRLAATVGFKAFMKMVDLKHVTVEEVITHFSPEDFKQRVWESTEITEGTAKNYVTKTATITDKTELHIDKRKEVKKTKVVKMGEEEEYTGIRSEPPLFLERFQGSSVTEKGTIRLVAKVTGSPVPEVTWLKNNEPLSSNSRIKLSYDGQNIELVITHANSEIDSGDYKCIASNTAGKASHGAKIIVDVETVKFTKKLKKSVEINEREALTLECETSHTVSTKWFYNDKELSGMDHRVIVQDGHIHKLIIKTATLSDEGSYKCTVKNQKTESTVVVKPTKPEFLRKLQDCEVTELQPAILEVEVTSETAEVIWQKDGQIISESDGRFKIEQDATVRKLIIRSTSVHDEGEYSCYLPDDRCSAEVTVVELPPEIITKMVDQTVMKGEKATFEIELTKGDALVRWFKNGKELQFSEHIQLSIDGKHQKLKIYNSELDDAGVYSCQVGVQKSSAKLTVKQIPLKFIKELPEYTTAPIENDATFIVELNRPDVEVEWLRRGRIISESTKYTIFSEKTIKKLVIHNVKKEDEVDYSCRVEDLITTSQLQVEILETLPKLFVDDTNKIYRIPKGENVTFTVKYTGTPKPSGMWSTNHTMILPSRRHQPTISEENAILTIRRTEPEDSGNYIIKLKNNCGEASAALTLIVLDVPSKPGIPELVEVTDTYISLHWKAPDSDGNMPINNYIIEYHDRDSSRWIKTTESITSTTHSVTTVEKHKEYIFRVIAVNDIGSSDPSNNSEYIFIGTPTAKEAPVILESLKDVKIGLHKNLILSSVITGNPEPEVTWFKDGKPIRSKMVTYEKHITKYNITKTNDTTSGIYSIKAINNMGIAETSCEVIVQESPKLEVDETLLDQMLRVNEQWKIVFIVSGYPQPDIIWKKNGHIFTSTKHTYYYSDDTSATIVIYSLDREDTATYTIIAENSAGFAEKELKLRVVDIPTPPEGPMAIKDIEKDSATISWHPPLDDGGLELSKYLIEKYEISSMTWNKVTEVERSVTSYTVQELLTNAEYMFRVYAQNPIGRSDPLESQTVTIKSSYKVPSTPRGPLEISGMTATSFTINWQVSATDGGSPIIEYIVEMKEANRRIFKKLGATKGAVTNYAVNYLEKDQGYNFKITARNSVGISEPFLPEDTIVAGSRIIPPAPPRNLKIIETSTRTATINWDVPEHNGGAEITGYVIEKKLEYVPSWEKVATIDSTVLRYTYENLKERTKYVFRVSAENCVGFSKPAVTSTVHLYKQATVPSPPTAPLEMRTIGPNAVVIAWGVPESDGGAPLTGYSIAIKNTKKTMWMEVGRVAPSIQKFTIRDLQEDHEFIIRIFARNEIGISDPLESDEPFKVLPSTDPDAEEFREVTDHEPISYSTETTTSWLRDNNMDADIYTYSKGKLLQKNEYFFRIWCYADELFK